MSKEETPPHEHSEHHEHAEHHEHTEHEHSEHHEHVVSKPKSSGSRMFLYLVVTAIVFLVVGFYAGGAISGNTVASASQNQVASNVVNFLQSRLTQSYPGLTAELSSVKPFENISGTYEVDVKITYQNETQVIPYYATSDGKYILGGVVDMTEAAPTTDTSTTDTSNQPSTQLPKTDKPVLDLYVWAFCPYGVQAEAILDPVYNLLKGSAEINVHYIGPVTTNKTIAANSCFAGQTQTTQDAKIGACCTTFVANGTTYYNCGLHNANEAAESARQVCILDKYGKDKLWVYLTDMDASCPSLYQDTSALNTCWKASAQKVGIDATAIETCSTSAKALQLLQADANLATQNNVHGSESFFINGVNLAMADYRWSADKLKTLVCNAFNSAPSVCSQTLSATGTTTTTAGGCGA